MSTRPDTTISHDVTLQLIAAGHASVPVPAVLRYAVQDPFAVHVRFRTGEDDGRGDVEWSFARSLLQQGLCEAAGRGDVVVWPEYEADQLVLCLSLSSPSGMALFETGGDRVAHFLEATYAAVPAGTESVHLDLDAELAKLLSRSARD
jgi:hypothetical protein